MLTLPKSTNQKKAGTSNKFAATTDNILHHLAFDNSLQANIITTARNGKIITANRAACKLLGYSKKELLTKSRSNIFDINESSFKKMLKQRTAEGKSIAMVTAIKKSGKTIPCEITSAVFMDENGIEKAIATIADMSHSILKQKNIDIKNKKIVADDIILAKSKQKEIDVKKEKIVSDNIVLAKSKQKNIDIKKEQVVAENITLAKSKQKEIDIKNKKIVADDIILAKSKQKEIDVKKEKIVSDNIVLAKLKQKDIDIRKEQVVAENIVLAKSKQKEIDVKNKKIVADDIALAKSKQKGIDIKKEQVVAENITLAKSKQKEIDIKKENIVADDIAQAKSEQKKIDIKMERIVAGNIVLAKSNQANIDIKNGKIVADNIVLAQAKSDARQTENSKWKKYIGKTSYDVMWDWDIVSGEVYVGDSIEEIFGYKVQNNTVNFKDFKRCLSPKEKNTVEKKLWNAIDSGNKSWNDSFMFKRYDGSVASAISRASIVRDEKGKAIRLIGALQDISKLEELEKILEKQVSIQEEDKFFLAAKLSFDVIWDWNLLTNEVFLGEGFEELFGYPIKNNKGSLSDWGNHIHPDDKEAFEKGLLDAIASSATHWEHAYRFTRADGSIARVFDRANIIRHAGGKAYRMIGAMQDISRQKELEDKLDHEIVTKGKMLIEYKESFKLIFNSSSDVLYDCDLITNEVIISDAFEKEFGYKITGNMTTVGAWLRHIHPDDKKAVMQNYRRVLASDKTEWKYSYRFLRADNSVANILSNRIILRDAGGKAYRVLGSMHDISKQKVLEDKLEQEIKLKEKKIAEATEDARDTERSVIGRELHDNVNQLLGISKLYLDMAKQGGENSKMYLSRSSEYTLTAIDEIRKLTKGLTTDIIKNLGLCEAIENITRETMEVNPVKIFCALKSFEENSVNDKFKLNLYRIIQEQLNNILKHARATKVIIKLSQNKKSIILIVSDNGVGFDTSKKRKGIGVDNIKSRAAAYNGTAAFISEPGHGCVLTATFPVTDMLVNKD